MKVESFNRFLEIVQNIRATNDAAGKWITLIQEYNNLHTKEEDMKQCLSQFVSEHRKKFPTSKKKAVLSSSSTTTMPTTTKT